jgi:hypothetical protein
MKHFANRRPLIREMTAFCFTIGEKYGLIVADQMTAFSNDCKSLLSTDVL